MVVDRPFFCAIVDSATNSILFMGAIVSPGAAGG
jgi:serine protease inhibitor